MKKKRALLPVLRPFIMLVLLSAVCGNITVAATLRIPPFKYLHRNWNTRHGLSQNSVYCMQRDISGNLWIGTGRGVVRFDGLKFETFEDSGLAAINNYQVTSLLLSFKDEIWIGTYGGGVVRYNDNRFTYYSQLTGLPNDFILSIVEGIGQEIWLGTQGGGLIKFVDGRFDTFTTASGLAHNNVNTLLRDSRNKIWIGTPGGLNRLDTYEGGNSGAEPAVNLASGKKPTTIISFASFKEKEGLPGNHVTKISEDRRKFLWVGTTRGVARSNRPVNEYWDIRKNIRREPLRFETIDAIPAHHVHAIHADWDNTTWVAAGKKLYHVIYPRQSSYGRPQVKVFTRPELFFKHPVLSLYQDNEGTLWFGTQDHGFGNLYKDTNTFCTVVEEYTNKDITSIYQESSGKIWVGTRYGRLFLYNNGNSREFSRNSGLNVSSITSLEGDRSGNTWIGSPQGLWRFERERFSRVRGAPGNINVIYVDREDQPWIGTDGNGLFKYSAKARKNRRKFRRYGRLEGLANLDVLAINQDVSGRVWVGTRGGLFRLYGNEFRHYTRKDGLGSDFVTDLFSDLDGSLWIATHGGGLTRFRGNTFKIVKSPDHFAGTVIFRILEDKMQRLWFSTNNGLYCLSKDALNRYADGLTDTLDCLHLHETRLPTTVFNGGFQPSGWRTDNGNLWFPTSEGITVIVPNKDLFRIAPPHFNFVEILADGKPVDLKKNRQLPAGTSKLQFKVSAPDFISPEKIRYKFQHRFAKHRLVGEIREGWAETPSIVGNVWTLENLDSGFYIVAVTASSSEGVWDYPRSATLKFSINETFFETIWFYVLLVIPAIGVFFGYQQYAKKRFKDKPGLFSQSGKYQTFTLNKRSSQKYLKGLIDFMDQEKPYLDSEMSMPKLARSLDMSKEELSQVINKELHLNFNAFMNKYRINEAKRKLRDPKENQFVILKIAHDVGFNSKSTFNSVFKQQTGMSPTQYRKKYQKPDEKDKKQ